MKEILLKFWSSLSKKRKAQSGYLIVLIVIAGIAEMTTLYLMGNFLALLFTPDVKNANQNIIHISLV